jgi:lactate dehydrogenase-like 2-hydroxyacid dehydrogenase
VKTSYDALMDIFECIDNFLRRLTIYTETPSTPAIAEMLVKIMIELLSVLALATKQIRQGRFSKSTLADSYPRPNA